MKVFKFGGASVATADKIRNVGNIFSEYKDQQILVVISAMGKTTNALEKVAEAFFAGKNKEALELFGEIKKQHITIHEELGNKHVNTLSDIFTEVEWLLHDKPVKDFDYYYDQIVCTGELLSTSIVSHYLNQNHVNNKWIDVRDIFRTDNNFREGRIDWTITAEKIKEKVTPLFYDYSIILTQGFIGATDENQSTTLGREGSDYSAAIFANLLNAESQTIWKDVEGVMNADPKLYKDAQWIKELNYKEVIEMAYYGAQVIHPKTIKPLQNKDIPLYVRSFVHPHAPGTIIHHKKITSLPPIIVYKNGQVLLQLTSRDFSFVGEGLTEEVYKVFKDLKFEPNLTQNAAISMLCVVDDHPEKIDAFAHAASLFSDINITKELTLLTIRHYNQKLIGELCGNHAIILQQQTPETIQLLMRADKGI